MQAIKFTIPIIFTNLFQQIYHVLDNMIAGKFAGELTLAAVGATGYLNSLIINLLTGLSVGVSAVIAQLEGEKNQSSIHKAVHSSMAISIIGGLLFGVIGIVFCKPILSLVETPDKIINESAVYMRVYFAGFVFLAIYNFGAAILRAKGDTKRPFLYLTIAGGVKVVLNYLFVAIMHKGAGYLALSTVISQLLSAGLVVYALLKEKDAYHLVFRKIRFYTKETSRILRNGVPIGLQSSVLALSNVILQSSINSFGEVVVAGAAASGTYNSVFYTVQTSMSHTATIFCGRFFGANEYKKLIKSLLYCGLLVMIFGVIVAAICLPMVNPMMKLFVDDPLAVSSGAQVVVVLCTTYWLSGLMEVVSGGLRAINKSSYAMVCTVVCLFATRITWIYTYFAGHRSLGILYYCYPLSWLVTLLVSLVVFIVFFKKLQKKERAAGIAYS